MRDCPSPEFTWRDLLVFVKHVGPHSHLYAAMFPDRAGWDKRNMLLALIADELRWLHWSKTVSAAEGGDPPEPIRRPGYGPPPRREGSKPKKPMVLGDKAIESLNKQAGRDSEDPDKVRKLHSLFRTAS